jgi:hypothetical protein
LARRGASSEKRATKGTWLQEDKFLRAREGQVLRDAGLASSERLLHCGADGMSVQEKQISRDREREREGEKEMKYPMRK